MSSNETENTEMRFDENTSRSIAKEGRPKGDVVYAKGGINIRRNARKKSMKTGEGWMYKQRK